MMLKKSTIRYLKIFIKHLNNLLKVIEPNTKVEPSKYDIIRSQYPGVYFSHLENISLQERVSIGPGAMIRASSPVTIGHDTMIASGTVIHTDTHSYKNHPMWKHRISRPITIGKHVWIGTNAIILPGIRIGDYAVVGAGSVVTSHVPEYAIVAGNPARIIKTRNILDKETDCIYPGTETLLDFLPDNHICTARIN